MIRTLAVGSMLLVLGCGRSVNGGGTGGAGQGGSNGGMDAGTTGGTEFSAAVDGTQTDFSNELITKGLGDVIFVQGTGNGMILTLFLPFAAAPGTYSCDPRDYSSKAIVLADGMTGYDTSTPDGVCTITVEINEQKPDGHLKGTFAGTVRAGSTSKAITAGLFDVLVPCPGCSK